MESTDVDKYNTTAFKKSLSSKAKLAILCPRPKGLLFFYSEASRVVLNKSIKVTL